MSRRVDPFTRYYISNMGYKTPCWIWEGARIPRGYGSIKRARKVSLVHRAFYEKFKGPIDGNLFIDHLCRNIICVNPDHLEAVTQAVNVQRGNSSKINIEIVNKIREDHRNGLSQKLLICKYKLRQTHISKIINNEIWVQREREVNI